MDDRPSRLAEDRILRLTGGAVVAAAAVSVAGWITGVRILVAWVPDGTPMVMNTTLCILLCGMGTLALAFGRRRWSAALGALAAAFGAVLLAQFLMGWNLGVNELFWRHQWAPPSVMPGQGAPAAAGAVMLFGLMLVFRSVKRVWPWLVPVLAGGVIALVLLPLLRYLAARVLPPESGGYLGMALPTIICLIALTAAMLRHSGEDGHTGSASLTLMSAAFGMLVSIGFLTLRSNAELVEANRMEALTFDERDNLHNLVTEVARLESSARAYALTGQDSFRSRDEFHRGEARRILEVLSRYAEGDPVRSDEIHRLGLLVQEKNEQAAELERQRENGPGAAARYLAGLPTAETSALVRLGGHMETEETLQLAERERVRVQAEHVTRMMQLIGSVLAVGLLGAAFTSARRSGAARRRAEAELRVTNRLQGAVLDGTVYSIIATRPDGVIEVFNAGAERMLGYRSAEMVGRGTPERIHDPAEVAARAGELTRRLGRTVPAGFEAFVALARLGEADEREWTYVRKDGSRLRVTLSVTALRDERGAITGFLGIAYDVTERMHLEDDLRLARDQALEASRLKSEFLATMSHEIRTPMNSILGMTELVLEQPLTEEQREMMRVIYSGAQNLLEIINDILDFSRIEAGKMRIEAVEFEPAELVDEALALLEPRALKKGLKLTRDIAPELEGLFVGDPGRIRQVLLNLVGNAIKFTDRGEVALAGRVGDRGNGRASLRLSVRDTGIGIAPEMHTRLFEAFTQVDGTSTRRFGGTGLGLAISRQLAELMGGSIGFTSEAGRGSTFWLELELPRAAGSAAGEPVLQDSSAEPAHPGGRHLLLVEDNPANQTVARLLLESMGYTIDTAENGEKALESLSRGHYDGVLMDCQMPVLDGYETTRRIRSGTFPGVNSRVPVIALTAYALAEDRAKCLAAGMNGYVTKPVGTANLRAALVRCGLGKAASEARAKETAAAADKGILDLDAVETARSLPGANGPSLWPEMLAIYLGMEPGWLAELDQLAAAGGSDPEPLAQAAHKLAGSCATMGAIEMRTAALAVERAARAKDWSGLPERLSALRAASARLREALARH